MKFLVAEHLGLVHTLEDPVVLVEAGNAALCDPGLSRLGLDTVHNLQV